MMRHLREYNKLPVFCASAVWDIWREIIMQGVETVLMNDEEFAYFLMAFMDKLPHDWNKQTFMGVKIIRDNA